jgi:hypothetical protein
MSDFEFRTNRVIKFTVLIGIIVILAGVLIWQQTTIENQKKALTNISQVKIADHFPLTPVYPGAVLQNSSCNDAQSMLFRSAWTLSGKVSEVMSWYTGELVKEGWSLDVEPGDITSDTIQYAEFSRGLFNSWLGRLQLSVEAQPDTSEVRVEMAFPAPDSEMEAE